MSRGGFAVKTAVVVLMVALSGCGDMFGDKEDERREAERHAQEIREAAALQQAQLERFKLEREEKRRVEEERKREEMAKEQARKAEEAERRAAKKAADELAKARRKEFDTMKRLMTSAPFAPWRFAPTSEKKMRATTNCVYVCFMSHPADGEVFYEVETEPTGFVSARQITIDSDGKNMSGEEFLLYTKGLPLMMVRKTGGILGNNVYVWGGKNFEGKRFPIPDEYDDFNPSNMELGGLYDHIGKVEENRCRALKYRIFLHKPGDDPQAICDLSVGDAITRYDFTKILYNELFEKRARQKMSEMNKKAKKKGAKRREIPSYMRSFQSAPVAGWHKIQSWRNYRSSLAKNYSTYQSAHDTSYGYGDSDMWVDVSQREVNELAKKCKISYKVVVE